MLLSSVLAVCDLAGTWCSHVQSAKWIDVLIPVPFVSEQQGAVLQDAGLADKELGSLDGLAKCFIADGNAEAYSRFGLEYGGDHIMAEAQLKAPAKRLIWYYKSHWMFCMKMRSAGRIARQSNPECGSDNEFSCRRLPEISNRVVYRVLKSTLRIGQFDRLLCNIGSQLRFARMAHMLERGPKHVNCHSRTCCGRPSAEGAYPFSHACCFDPCAPSCPNQRKIQQPERYECAYSCRCNANDNYTVIAFEHVDRPRSINGVDSTGPATLARAL